MPKQHRTPDGEPRRAGRRPAVPAADPWATRSQVTNQTYGPGQASLYDTVVSTPIPATFGRYRIVSQLGHGGMGVVYLAEDTQLHRQVALKIPHRAALADPAAVARFYQEARTAGTLRHPNLCPVYDIGAIDGIHYLTMAYIPGRSISSYLEKGKLPAARPVALLIRKVALALAEAHKHDIIHRDLKPSNIMLDDRNEPIVMDFGLARQINTESQTRITQNGVLLGTPCYMSPEQVRCETDRIGPPSDIYSLGVMLYQLLTGRLPFEGPLTKVLTQIVTDAPPRPTSFYPLTDRTLEAICLKMLAKEPEWRFAGMKEVADALAEYLKTGTVLELETESTLVRAISAAASLQQVSEPPSSGSLAQFPTPIRRPRPRDFKWRRVMWKLRRHRWWILTVGAILMLAVAAQWASELVARYSSSKHTSPVVPALNESPGEATVPE